MIDGEVVARAQYGKQTEKNNNGSNKRPDRRMSQHAIPNLDAAATSLGEVASNIIENTSATIEHEYVSGCQMATSGAQSSWELNRINRSATFLPSARRMDATVAQ